MKVKWAGMEYAEISKNGWLRDIDDHIESLGGDKGREYAAYLITFCKFPKGYKGIVN